MILIAAAAGIIYIFYKKKKQKEEPKKEEKKVEEPIVGKKKLCLWDDTQNPYDSTFCNKCGKELITYCIYCGNHIPPHPSDECKENNKKMSGGTDVKNCRECNWGNPVEAKFCGRCGKRQQE